MIKRIFSNHKQFALLFFLVLLIDAFVKLNFSPIPYRFLSKPWIILLLFTYFYFNKTGNNKRKHLWMFLALAAYLIGDLLIINHINIILLSLSLLFFSIGKIFFCLKFSHKKDFNVLRLIPFTIIIFGYVITLIGYLYENLQNFLIPALTSFFLTLLMLQFAYLRKGVFNTKSYTCVLFGVLFYVISEGMMAVKTFKVNIPFQDILIIMFYGIGLYFMVFGVVTEREEEHELEEDYENEISLF